MAATNYYINSLAVFCHIGQETDQRKEKRMPKHDHLRTLPITERYPEEVWRAVNFAARAHEKQIRKMSGNHYIEHPFGVLELVRTVTDDIPTQQAAVLHDTVEDTYVTLDDLERGFGAKTARIVWGVTKDETIPSWRERNEAYLHRLENEAPDESSIVALGDKIHNITDMTENYLLLGDGMWQKFAAKPDDQLWWYRSVLEVAERRTPECPLIPQLETRIELFRTQVVGRYARQATALGI